MRPGSVGVTFQHATHGAKRIATETVKQHRSSELPSSTRRPAKSDRRPGACLGQSINGDAAYH